jgi:hypothetical protein
LTQSLHYLLCDNIGSMELYQAIQAIVTCAFAVKGLGLLNINQLGMPMWGITALNFFYIIIFFFFFFFFFFEKTINNNNNKNNNNKNSNNNNWGFV